MTVDRRDPDDGRVRVTAIRIDAEVARWMAAKARAMNVGNEHVIETALIWMRDADTAEYADAVVAMDAEAGA